MEDVNLCEKCRRVLTTWEFPRIQHHADYDSLMVSVTSGCPICRWLSFQVHRAPGNLPEGLESFQTFCSEYNDYTMVEGSKSRSVCFRGECSWATPFSITVRIYPHKDGPFDRKAAPELIKRNHLPPSRACQLEGTDIGSDKSIAIMANWLDTCNRAHPYCPTSPHKTFFPTRIIDVQKVEDGTVVLRTRNEVMKTLPGEVDRAGSQEFYPEYWTLSHRWGDPKLVTQLLKDNEQRFRRGIVLEELSPTFRDAVNLVHKLGYRYIWIDSLCIIQDSDEEQDWKQEAPTMKDVYGNSCCNISAIRSSHDVSLGLFGERFVEPLSFYPLSADLNLPRDEENTTGKWNIWLDSLWINEMNKSPLSSRGWVVQERFLSRRIIHFTQSQIYWECLECCRCEADPMDELGLLQLNPALEIGRQAREYKATLRKIIKASISRRGRRTPPWKGSKQTWPTPRDCWRIMVTTYSRCDLTKETDRLIAISGVAKKFEEMYVRDRYFAGIWKEGIHTDLLWESNAFQGGGVRRSGTRVPSWSWASVRGGSVTVPTAYQKFGGEPNPCIQFVAARIRPQVENNDSKALPQSSELEIECCLQHFKKDARSETIEIFEDEGCQKKIVNLSEIVSNSLRLDTNDLVQRFDRNPDIKGQCIPVQEGSVGYGIRTVRYLLLESVMGPVLRYKRLGTLTGRGFGLNWDKSKHTRITLV